MNMKHIFVRFLFLCEVLIFGYFYFYGSNGLPLIYQLQKENELLEQQMKNVQKEGDVLQEEIERWDNDSFYVERYAREKLAMGRKGEEIFI